MMPYKISKNKISMFALAFCLSLLLVVAAFSFSFPADFETYAMMASLEPSEALKTFNFIELGSLFVISLLPRALLLNSDIYLVTLSIVALLYLISKLNSFYSKLSLIFLLAGFYGSNLLLSQYKMLLAICFTVFIFEYSKQNKAKNKLLPLSLFLFHSQALLYSLAHYFSLKQCLLYSCIVGVFISQLIIITNIYFGDIYLFSKIATYTVTEGDALSNFTLLRLILFSIATFFLIQDKENYYYKCYLVCVLFSLFSISFPVIAGRIASMAVILEPFIIDNYKNKVYRQIFLYFCILITIARYVQ